MSEREIIDALDVIKKDISSAEKRLKHLNEKAKSREIALAITNIQQSRLWVNESVMILITEISKKGDSNE